MDLETLRVGGVRYGFLGQENDDEIKGEGNSYTTEFRMLDPRIGRFFAIDPLTKKYPFYSPYQFSGNQVIASVELEGLEPDIDLNQAQKGIKYEAGIAGDKNVLYKWVVHESSNGSRQWLQTSDPPRDIRNSILSLINSDNTESSKKTTQGNISKPEPKTSSDTPWMETALEEKKAGVQEEPLGSNSGPRVDEYLKSAGASSPNAWCASFIHWCLAQNGIKGAGALGKNYLNWGIKLDVPKYGAIAIFTTGHVGLYMGTMPNGNYKILHGNWSDKVTISDYTKPEEIQEFVFPETK